MAMTLGCISRKARNANRLKYVCVSEWEFPSEGSTGGFWRCKGCKGLIDGKYSLQAATAGRMLSRAAWAKYGIRDDSEH
ncbi:uncharacterized protein TrAtP1_008907 [Trichoderma atroviride]|uniref:uncharacterized protein n=1 Tax=Hypocrea atroviridis TaxID=63577 RepID=UPI00332E2189|nr:hypothetical protein TrAtP1_008907 [Trichoderma atroviride]